MAFIVSSTLGALVVISLFVAVMIPFMMGTVRRCNGFVGCGLGPSWFRESHWNGDSKRDAARATDYCIVLDADSSSNNPNDFLEGCNSCRHSPPASIRSQQEHSSDDERDYLSFSFDRSIVLF